ncbi:molybdopterin molybdotransferase MoeA [Aggregicoccus sp. 17bor-14]|uniref:molybdopterin molybdotransferase MoeA n=1 Tax=Myxococcaceae TaxID=31 RepID=UPI00129C36D0|nr:MULTISPECIES: gephyrin-like molybdotransferase Glp [Myxococcaceae]MBF5044271.1 molybdopterin molybdotransferase MoeA [Simulacricoccus sp. 17bor-14]MRI90021.1 molybdopterin molybdotransferase MoeA [Aggregicoccus sp. 17bor-14]
MPLEQARARALALGVPLPPVPVPLALAWGRYLAEPLAATRALPGYDNSAMDGYAVRWAETRGATRDAPARLRVVGTCAAGALPAFSLAPGEAARIFTGAPLPAGADAVVRQEAARPTGPEGGEVLLFVTARPGEHVRRRGEELAEGAPLFPAGLRLESAALGVLASLGLSHARVRPAPRVALLTVGDELLEAGTPALSHQVYDSNRALLTGLCLEAGAQVVHAARASDEPEAISRAFEAARAAGVDLLVTSGGASVGDRDRVKAALREGGATLEVDGVALKPGKPVGLARWGGLPVLVLPGNPGAATVAFDQLGRTLLLALQGVREERRCVRVRLREARHKQAGLTYLLSARQQGGEAHIRPQGAGQLLQNVGAEGWVVLPAGRADFPAGEEVSLELFAHPVTHALALEGA